MGACTSCDTYSLLTCYGCQDVNATKYYKYIGDTICATDCPLGQYIDDVHSPNVCLMCDANCVGCYGSATNCTLASGCKVNNFYNNATNSCVLVCPDGTFGNVATKFCQFCTSGCALCYGDGLSKCTKCTSYLTTNYYLQINLDQCSTGCNTNEYGDPTFYKCFLCNSACATCSSSTVCATCQSVNGIAYYLSGTICTVTCPINQFGSLSNFQCTNCASECATCFGSLNTQCYSCQNYNSTNYYLVFGTDYCNTNCPDGQYQNATDFTCRLCSSGCLTCVTTSLTCLSCGFSTLGYNLYLQNNKCLMACMNGYWGNITTFTCDACTVGCATCTSSGLSSCSVCGNDSSTIYYKYIGSTVCNTTCPDGQYIAAAVPNLCQPCSSICSTCVGSAENCTSATCAQNYFFLSNQCLINCPNGYYASASVRQCLTCATGCATCSAAGNAACTVCSASYYLQIGLTQCLGSCNVGEFANAVGNVCSLCVAACASCTSLAVCQSCQSVNGIAYFLSGSSCTVACPSYQFGKLTNNQCTNCADGCATCFGSSLSNCYSCNASSTAVNYYLVYGTNTCNNLCPDGQYANSTIYQCLLCNANCLTCVTTSSYCLTCGFSTIGANLYLHVSSCLLTCPDGYYANSVGNTCDPCHYGCATCTGPLLTNCTVCSDYNNSGTIVTYYKIVAATTCDVSCPGGQFINSKAPNSCAYCDNSCISCSISSSNCTINACASGYYYLPSTSNCLSTCPNNYYANNSTGICTVCSAGCQLCYGGSLTTCTQCQITASNVSYFKIIDINTCTTVCPPGQYPYQLLLAC
jgi:proprotein convertase subtilisin/kexin type 5